MWGADMTSWPDGLVIIILVTVGTIAGDRRSVKSCPCTQGCCEANWFQYKDACYLPVKTHKFWRDAEESCAAQNANLASVHSPEEDQFIFYLMGKPRSYWLGAQKIHNAGHDSHWKWTDNSSWQYASMKLRYKPHNRKDHVIVGRSDDDDDDDDDDDGHIPWNYANSDRKKHVFVCKYLLM